MKQRDKILIVFLSWILFTAASAFAFDHSHKDFDELLSNVVVEKNHQSAVRYASITSIMTGR